MYKRQGGAASAGAGGLAGEGSGVTVAAGGTLGGVVAGAGASFVVGAAGAGPGIATGGGGAVGARGCMTSIFRCWRTKVAEEGSRRPFFFGLGLFFRKIAKLKPTRRLPKKRLGSSRR